MQRRRPAPARALRRADRRAARRAARAAAARCAFEPGVELFREGEPADFWWVLVDGAIDLVRHVGREDTVVGADGRAGPLGRRVPGLGRARRLPRDRPGVARRPGAAGAGRRAARPGRARGSRSAAHLIDGLYRTARTIESTARQREALVTLGTLAAGLAHEINNPAAAATRAVDALEDACADAARRRSAGWPTDEITAAAVRRPRRPAARDRAAAGDLGPARRGRPRGGAARPGWPRHGVERDWTIAPPLAAAGVDVAWCERAADGARRRRRSSPALEWVASTLSAADAARRGEGVDPADLRAGRRGAVVLADGPGVDAADRRDRGPREHAGDARPQAARRGRRSCATTAPTCPRIEAYAGELNQVWTNLIDNAVDAMDGAGTLRVDDPGRRRRASSSRSATPAPGMPPEVAAPRVRGVLHHQGRRQGHRPRPRHRPPDRRRAARRHDRHRRRPGRDRAPGPAPR